MIALFYFVVAVLASPFKPKSRLEAENAVLRHQLIVLRRKVRGRARLTNTDRWFFVLLYRWFPSILSVLMIIRPETLVRWHRAGFRRYWRWKSRRRGGRPQIETELRALIRQMSMETVLNSMVALTLKHEAPIYEDVLVARIARAHGFQRSGDRIQKAVSKVVGRRYRKTQDDGRTVVWGENSPETVLVSYRKSQSEVRSHTDTPVVELASLALPYR